MSMLDSLRSKLGIDPEADSYVDDTEENVFPGGQGAAAAQEYTQQQEIKQHSNKVVNINATTQLQVVLVKPERFDDASSIADQLNAKHTVVLNLESASKEVSRRLIDFLSGVAYANNGQIKRVATSTFIITPYNVDIMGDLLDELENELGIETYAVNWPIGCGKEFQGVYNRRGQHIDFFSGVSGKRRADREEVLLDDPRVGELIGADRWQQLRDDVELLGAGREFDMDEVRRGRLLSLIHI